VVGVADPALLELIAGGLRELGHERALVVHGQPGMDEISPIGPTDVIELKDGELSRYTIQPSDLLDDADLDPAGLAGGDPADNARVVHGVLAGELRGAARAAVLINAAAALYVADRAASLRDGVTLAEATLDAGSGLIAFERLREATRRS
jgi:anthranilate phosphoribosyltransferase